MTISVGINGFGRIGRAFLRAVLASKADDIRIVAINDTAPAETMAHLLEFDSLHGRLPAPVMLTDGGISIGAQTARLTQQHRPEELSWAEVDIALECSGQFLTPDDAARHFENGASRVLLSAPPQGDIKTCVYGVNHTSVTGADRILSNASCTTNCLVPVAKILHDACGIEAGMMTTVHSYTSTQNTHDGPHADLYRARAAGLSMIPTSTGAAISLGAVMPELAGRITGHAIRVPTPNVSCIDLVVHLARRVDAEDINACFADASKGAFSGIIDTTDRKLVSADFRQDQHSAIIACDQTRVQGNMARILAWYDNEWGFSNRLIDVLRVMAKASG
ncbi:MAG: type I glyceraldehyde-3-phosphate dehydrogenase [Roseobacter sp.]